jgi:hypothetical protein
MKISRFWVFVAKKNGKMGGKCALFDHRSRKSGGKIGWFAIMSARGIFFPVNAW